MNKETVHLVCACNASFVMPLCVMLASLVEHFDPDRDLVIHIISNDATTQDRENIRKSVEMNRPGLTNITINWHSINWTEAANRMVPGYHFTRDNYARLFAPLLLPETCEKAIYLDGDMVVLADIAPLFDSTLSNDSMIHAVHDVVVPWVSSPLGVFDYAERGIPAKARCFNSGIMVINLKRWREQDLTRQLLDYLAHNGSQVRLADQGALNAFLYDDWTPLDNRWNQDTGVLLEDWWIAGGYSREEWQRTLHEPYIIHFTGHKKPWLKGRYPPRQSFFYKYLRKTVYKDSIPFRLIPENIFGFRLYFILWKWIRKIPGVVKP